jgi:hypothetical protein
MHGCHLTGKQPASPPLLAGPFTPWKTDVSLLLYFGSLAVLLTRHEGEI